MIAAAALIAPHAEAATCRAMIGRALGEGVHQSPFAACLMPLLEALGWNGSPRALFEALPHFEDHLDLIGFRNILARLGYATEAVAIAEGAVDTRLLPCLFVPESGSPRVLLRRDGEITRAFDGWLERTRGVRGAGAPGTAFLVRRREEAPEEVEPERWMVRVGLRFRRTMWAVLGVTLLFNILGLATPIFTMSIYDTVIPAASVDQLGWLGLGIALALGFEFALRALRARTLAHVAGRIDSIVGSATFQKLLHLPIGFTESASIGAQVSRLKEFEAIRDFFTGPLAEAILDLPFAFLFLFLMFILAGWLALIPCAAAIAFIVVIAAIAPWCRRLAATSSLARTREQRFLVEALANMRPLRYTGSEQIWMDRFRAITASAATLDVRVAVSNQVIQSSATLIMMGSGAVLVGVGTALAIEGQVTFGALVAAISLNWRVLTPLQSGLLALNRWEQVRDGAAKISRLMRLPGERLESAPIVERPIGRTVTFSNVTHRYAPDAEPALLGVTCEIKAGEVIAIAGANGSGKSTLVKLLAGLYRPQAGAILIDGIDIRQFDPIDLRQRIGVVPQSSAFFYGTIAQNLRFAMPTATDEAIVAAATRAGAHDAVMALPKGYDTRLSEKALAELPGGFRQKLAIARAYLRDPGILILDEPGQMIDEAGDKVLMAEIAAMRGRVTVILVTHRPSHLRICDRVLLLDRGRVAFLGPAEEALPRLFKSAS